MSMITASVWVPRGSAASFPVKYDINETELDRISKLAKLQLDDAKFDLYNRNRNEGPKISDESSNDGANDVQPLQSQG